MMKLLSLLFFLSFVLVPVLSHPLFFPSKLGSPQCTGNDCPQCIGPPCPRYYNNTQRDYLPGDNTTLPSDLVSNMTLKLGEYIGLILESTPPSYYDDFSVFTGTSGRALLFLKLYYNQKEPTFLEIAANYIDTSLRHTTVNASDIVGFLESYIGTASVAAIIYDIIDQSPTPPTSRVLSLLELVSDAVNTQLEIPFGPADDTYDTGRAGLLYAYHLLRRHFGSRVVVVDDGRIARLASLMIQNGIRSGNGTYLAWTNPVYPDIVFWGQGHGSTGIIQQLLDIDNILANTTVKKWITQTLDYWLTLQYPSGNFPTPQVPPYPMEPDVLIQWCHGAPSFIAPLMKAYSLLGDVRYLNSALKAADAVWARGLLTKGLMLGHGISGNTYQFLYIYNTLRRMKLQNPKVTDVDEKKYLFRAIQFQKFVLQTPIVSDVRLMRKPTPSPYMFFVASYASASVLWSDMLTNVDEAHMPAFEPYY